MRVSYLEAMVTPTSVIDQDLEFMSLEHKYGEQQEQSNDTNVNTKRM